MYWLDILSYKVFTWDIGVTCGLCEVLKLVSPNSCETMLTGGVNEFCGLTVEEEGYKKSTLFCNILQF